ncbi:MAG: hypothetical protein AVDCRST_MAG06-1770, partial [uncultured Nocardioides sp.]
EPHAGRRSTTAPCHRLEPRDPAPVPRSRARRDDHRVGVRGVARAGLPLRVRPPRVPGAAARQGAAPGAGGPRRRCRGAGRRALLVRGAGGRTAARPHAATQAADRRVLGPAQRARRCGRARRAHRAVGHRTGLPRRLVLRRSGHPGLPGVRRALDHPGVRDLRQRAGASGGRCGHATRATGRGDRVPGGLGRRVLLLGHGSGGRGV